MLLLMKNVNILPIGTFPYLSFDLLYIKYLNSTINQLPSVRAFTPCLGGHWVDSWLNHTKDFKFVVEAAMSNALRKKGSSMQKLYNLLP